MQPLTSTKGHTQNSDTQNDIVKTTGMIQEIFRGCRHNMGDGQKLLTWYR